jgi:hypothetical protein
MRTKLTIIGVSLSLAVWAAAFDLPAQTPSPTPVNYVSQLVPVYSTYLGGSRGEAAYHVKIAVDSESNIYVTSDTFSQDFPTCNPYQPSMEGDNYYDAVLTKLSSSGSTLIFSTYLGGESGEFSTSLVLDEEKRIYIAGETSSSDFPTKNSYQAALRGRNDAFVAKFSSSGSELEYCTMVGGVQQYLGIEIADDLCVDSEGHAYIGGQSDASDYPLRNPYQSVKLAGTNAIMTKLSSSGSALEYSTYLGGSGNSYIYSIAVDSEGYAYATGETEAHNFPVVNAYQPQAGGGQYSAFLTKFSSSGSSLVFSTYYAENEGNSGGMSLAINTEIYLGHYNGNDWERAEYVSKFASSGSCLLYRSGFAAKNGFLGDLVLGDDGKLFTIATNDDGFPDLKNAYQPINAGEDDAMICSFAAGDAQRLYSSYWGGRARDEGGGIAVDREGSVYVSGKTWSDDFPTLNAYQASLLWATDIFISKFKWEGHYTTPSPVPSPSRSPSPSPSATPAPDPQTLPFREDFEGTWQSGAPERWRKQYIRYDVDWLASHGGAHDKPPDPHSGLFNALFDDTIIGGDPVTRLISPPLVFPEGSASPRLTFWHASWQSSLLPNVLTVYYRVSPEGSWTQLANYATEEYFWVKRTLLLPEVSNAYSLCFQGKPHDGFGVCLDDIEVLAAPSPTPTAKITPAPSRTPTPTPVTPTPPPTPHAFSLTLESGDYDGHGEAEIAIFRPSNGLWSIAGLSRVYFGIADDIPVSGDYAGDGTSRVAIFRPLSSLWAVRNLTQLSFGRSGDIPIPRDYDRDGTADAAVFRPGDGIWDVRDLTYIFFGRAGDMPVPADYDNDGWIDAAIFRQSSGLWAIRGLTYQWFGMGGDIPVPADYDLDGTTEIAVYRPSTGLWAGILSQEDPSRIYLGIDGDIPVPANYIGGDGTQPAVFRPSSGHWAIRNLTRCWFGSTNDLPVTR